MFDGNDDLSRGRKRGRLTVTITATPESGGDAIDDHTHCHGRQRPGAMMLRKRYGEPERGARSQGQRGPDRATTRTTKPRTVTPTPTTTPVTPPEMPTRWQPWPPCSTTASSRTRHTTTGKERSKEGAPPAPPQKCPAPPGIFFAANSPHDRPARPTHRIAPTRYRDHPTRRPAGTAHPPRHAITPILQNNSGHPPPHRHPPQYPPAHARRGDPLGRPHFESPITSPLASPPTPAPSPNHPPKLQNSNTSQTTSSISAT